MHGEQQTRKNARLQRRQTKVSSQTNLNELRFMNE